MKKLNKLKIGILIILIIVALTITVFGRYIYNSIREAYFLAEQFYFSSNILTANGVTYQYNNWGGIDNYEIKFELYSYESSLSKLDYDLDYTVTCSTSDSDKVRVAINSEAADAPTTYNGTIPASTNLSNVTVYVIPKEGVNIELNETIKVQVTASTSKPYQKTISCEFTIKAATKGLNTYTVEDSVNNEYAILKLTCPGEGTTITIEVDPKQLRIDANDEVYIDSLESNGITTENTYSDGNSYVKKIIYNMPGETTKYVKFYKVDSTKNYTYPGFAGTHPIKVSI